MRFFHPDGLVVEETGKSHKVSELFSLGDDFFNFFKPKKLVLVLGQNDLPTLFFYINAIERGLVPILMEVGSDDVVIDRMLNTYRPDYIFGPKSWVANFSNSNEIVSFQGYSVIVNANGVNSELPEELSLLLSTSGSTGSPKLVRLSLKNMEANADAIIEYLSITKEDKAITNLPMYYSYGLSIIHSHLRAGATIVLTTETVIQRKFWDLFKEHKITSLSGVPYTYDILSKIKFLKMELPSLRKLTQAGGKLSLNLVEQFHDYCKERGIDFYVMYGQTEGTARLSYLEPDKLSSKMGSIGKSIPGGNLFLQDEDGQEIRESEVVGELVYTGKNVMLGYAECRDDLIKGDELNGVLKTGDLAYFDTDGYFFLVGRKKRFVKLFGNRINLDDIEHLLRTEGISNAATGSDKKLMVYIENESDFEGVVNLISKKLGIHPTAFEVRIIGVIPKNSSGKILYTKLAIE